MNCRDNKVVKRWRWRNPREVEKEGVDVAKVEVEVEYLEVEYLEVEYLAEYLGEGVAEASTEEEEEVMDEEEEVWIEMTNSEMTRGRWRG